MSKKMVTTQPGLFLFTDKDSAFQVTETGATVNGKELGMSEAWAWIMDAIDTKAKRVPDPATGLMPCGCGGKAILFHQPDIEGPGSDGDRWAVFCEKTCGMETSDMTSREYAVETWNTGMGYTAPPLPGAIGPETDGTAPNGDKGAEQCTQ